VAYKEQFLLYLKGPTVNFGHRRWREGEVEGYDASAWLGAGPDRVLLVPGEFLKPCFDAARDLRVAGRASGDDWYLVRGTVNPDCASKGDADRAIGYDPRPPMRDRPPGDLSPRS